MSVSTKHTERLLVTGGAGFIGAHVVGHLVRRYPSYKIYNLDALSYAADSQRLADIAEAPNYQFIQADLKDKKRVDALFERYNFTSVIHLAAETHVDKSIQDPSPFLNSNVLGTFHLLEAARKHWSLGEGSPHRFYQISTDEVYGSLEDKGFFNEKSPYAPNSPYAATKASADHLLGAYATTYKLPVLLSHAPNNYGPYQYPEKLLPVAIAALMENRSIPLYGDGSQVREWLYVTDHVAAIDCIFHKGQIGKTYHISSGELWTNKDFLDKLAVLAAGRLGRSPESLKALIKPVTDRPGHDFRYALEGQVLKKELNWHAVVSLDKGLSQTIDWYLANSAWLDSIRNKDYQSYYEKQYGNINP